MLAGSRDGAEQAGREQRFRRLFVEHYSDVLGYAMRRTDQADAEDAAAMVFLTVWRRFDELPDGPAAVLWLYGVARRVVANQQRSQRRRQRLLTRLRLVRPEPVAASNRKDHQVSSMVRDALNRLKPADQEVLRLVTWEGLSYAEVGRVLGCSEGTVAVRVHRARRRMERQLRSAGFVPTRPVDRPLAEGGGL